MVMPGVKHYRLECPKCGWSDIKSVRRPMGASPTFRGWPMKPAKRTLLETACDWLSGVKFPSSCPKCGGKLNIEEDLNIQS